MNAVRRAAYATFAVACLHLVFGAIVRITGSGMGCGPHWPRCYGYWFPPMSRPDLVIEVTHRYLASVLLLALIALVVTAWRHRAAPGVGGRGGVLRPTATALALGFGAALLGAVTVKFQNAPLATLAHWTVAMSLVAAVAAAVVRTGGLGGASATLGGATMRARRATLAAAGLALVAVVMGGLTAKTPGAPVACGSFLPFCNPIPDVGQTAIHVQVTHRWIAVLLILHLVGLFFAFRKRGEPAVVRRAGAIALSLGILQLLVAGAMIGMHLPPVLRSLHEATGVSIWITCFVLALLTRVASDPTRVAGGGDAVPTPPAVPLPESGVVRVERAGDGARASAVVDKAPVIAMTAPVVIGGAAGQLVRESLIPPVVTTEPSFASDVDDERGVAASLAIAAIGAEVAGEATRDALWIESSATSEAVSNGVATRADVDADEVSSLEIAEIIDGIAAVGAASGQETWAAEYWVADGGESADVGATPAADVVAEETSTSAIAEFEIGDGEDVADEAVNRAAAEVGAEAAIIGAMAVDASAVDAGLAVGDVGAVDGTVVDVVPEHVAPVDVAVVEVPAVDVAAVDVAADDAAADAMHETVSGAGAPPHVTNTTASAEHHHPAAAPRTIFDAAERDDDEADLLAALGADPFDDTDHSPVAELDDEILSLDEEFSRRAVDAESDDVPETFGATTGDDAAVAIPAGVVSPASTVAPANVAAYHSVLVIVARGAGF